MLAAGAIEVDAALRDAEPAVFWLDDPARPVPEPPLRGETTADLCVVGGGYTGLWTALLAKERDPGRDVVLLEGREVGWAASGRNGGFCEASLTHGLDNGLAHFSDEIDVLERLGRENLDGIGATLQRHGIDAQWERTGTVTMATAPWQARELREAHAELRAHGREDVALLDSAAARGLIASPTFLAGLLERDSCALVHPARLAWGLKAACLRLGVRIFERARVLGLGRVGAGVVVRTRGGAVRASRVALGTNAFRSPLRRVRPFIVPVYDHVLVTEPLTAAQRRDLGWSGRQGLADAGNQFHYARLTADDRVLWGGYDAIYHYGRRVDPAYEQRPATERRLAEHFLATFPQLEGVRFTHRWAGAIDTCTRFCPFFLTAAGGRVASAAGYTGLGVGASRFAGQVLLDLLDGLDTERTALQLVRRPPVPFPPDPIGWAGIQLTRWSLSRADARDGQRNVWLRTLDRLGLGFDS